MMRRSWRALVLGAALALAAATAGATTAIYLPREDLVLGSAVIARVQVGEAVSAPSADGTTIVTRTTLVVRSVLKGSAPPLVVVEQVGGTVGDQTVTLHGDATLERGEEAVVFLVRGEAGVHHFFALAQSVFHVTAEGMVRRDLHDMALMERRRGRIVMRPLQAEPLESLDHLLADVARIVKQQSR